MLYVIFSAALIIFVFALSEPTEVMWIVFGISGVIFAFTLYEWSNSSQIQNTREGYCKNIGSKKATSIGCISKNDKLVEYPKWLRTE